MSSDLEQFAESFSSEKELRERVATLFSKLHRVQGVQITHGSQEYGKDIIFYAQDALDDWVLHACVVKNDKITGAADGSTAARNVFVQVEQALDTPHIDPAGQEENVGRVYVISPYDCAQTTMRSIQGKLKGRSGQVTFLCGRLLFEQFAKHWSEYLAFETTLIGSYLARLQSTFGENDPIAFLMGQHQILSIGSKGLAKVYVPQRFRKVLQEFELLDLLPKDRPTSTGMSEEEMDSFTGKLLGLSGLLRHPESWGSPELQDALAIASELTSFAELLRSNWHIEFERIRSDYRRLRKPPLLRASARVPVSVSTTPMWHLVSRASHILTVLEAALQASNRFAKNCTDILAELGSQDHLNYCAIYQLIQSVPTAFRATSPAGEFFLAEDLLSRTQNSLFISAPAGYGKTSFCKWNFLNDVQHLAENKSEVAPIYVPLHQLATAPVTDINETFIRTDDVKRLVQSAVKNSRRVRFYLDGLDEVSTISQQERLMKLASRIPSEIIGAQVVVTGRDYVSGHWLRWLPRVQLAELTEDQIRTFTVNWLGNNAPELEKFNNELTRSRTLRSLMHVPLLGTLVIAVFKKMQSLPENKCKLYEIFVDLMCGGWDIAKNVRRETKYGSGTKLAILSRLASYLHMKGRRQAEESDVQVLVKDSFPSFQESWRAVLHELLEDGLLVRIAIGLQFAHLSFQEYLTAKDLTADPTGERQKVALRRFLRGEDWWREVLAFYVSMCQHPDEIAEWVNAVGIKLSGDLRSEDLDKRWDFLMRSLQDTSPGWVPPQLHRRLQPSPGAASKRNRSSDEEPGALNRH